MNAKQMAIAAKRGVRLVVNELVANHKPTQRRPRNGDGLPLFCWLRSAKRYADGSPVMHLCAQTEPRPRLAALMSRTEAAAHVVRRIARRNALTAVQLHHLHVAITQRYGGTRSRRKHDEWQDESPFRAIYSVWGVTAMEYRLLDRACFGPWHERATSVFSNSKLTDALLMAHLYAATKPEMVNHI